MARPAARALLPALYLLLAGCGDDGPLGPVPNVDGGLVNGCPTYPDPVATPGEDVGHTYASFAVPFFESYCNRCHGSTVTGAARNTAPEELTWDVEAVVRDPMNLVRLRTVIVENNFMPSQLVRDIPRPTCDQRV
jgi:hypothetical protein